MCIDLLEFGSSDLDSSAELCVRQGEKNKDLISLFLAMVRSWSGLVEYLDMENKKKGN